MSKKKFYKTKIVVEIVHNGKLDPISESLIQTENMLSYLTETKEINPSELIATTTKVSLKSKKLGKKQVENIFQTNLDDLF